jgi:hypothetical protein
MLKFSPANAKTENLRSVPELKKYLAGGNKVYSFDLSAGHSCPFAKLCLSKVVVGKNGKRKLKDGKYTAFRCFSASQEISYPNVYNARQHNFSALRGLHLNDMIAKLDRNIPSDMGICRIHVSGDFFSPDYLFAWINMAMKYRYILFYAYTKSIPYWLKYREYLKLLPNFVLTASYGGKYDDLIKRNRLRFSRVVFSKSQAGHLPIDHDDSHAAINGKSFALLLHGVQPAGTVASKSLQKLRGAGSYSRKN